MGIISRGTSAAWVGTKAVTKVGAQATKRGASFAGEHGGKAMLGPLAVAGIGTAAVGGAVSGVLDRQGPYPALQEAAFGDPEAFRTIAKAEIGRRFTDSSDDHYGRNDVYYGQAVAPSSGRIQPVPGNVVFGMYNTRR